MSEVSETWFNFAREDLLVAQWTLAQGIYNQTCFHSQQCVEKVIKGLIATQDSVPPKIHNLSHLLSLLTPNP